MSDPVKLGVVGCGEISEAYLRNLTSYAHLEVRAVADLDVARARTRAEQFGIAHAYTVDEVLGDDEIELLVNLTNPAAHAEVALAAIAAGKAVYNEKPFAADREDGRRMLAAAREAGVRIGGAPDTWLTRPVQSALHVLEAGTIGDPVAATAIFVARGHEGWHSNPTFFYKPGGGPLLDGGPYRLSALVALLGPVARVTGLARASYPERTIHSAPHAGETIAVEVPTHVTALLEFASGVIATTIHSWDLWASEAEAVCEVQGSIGTVTLPSMGEARAPRMRLGEGGPPYWSEERRDWEDVPLDHGPLEGHFGIGIAEMAAALRSGLPHRATGDFAYHALDVMQSIYDAVDGRRVVELESTCERPAPLTEDWLAEHGL